MKRSLHTVTDAAAQIAAGRYTARVAAPDLGADFATLADTYNSLAAKLESTEATRRRMLADLAHEMRTPLATVDAHLEAVEDGIRDLDSETLLVLRESTRRLRRLAEDIGAISRAEEGGLNRRPQPVDAASLATAAVAAAADGYAAKGVTLHTDAHPAGFLTADSERIGQILGNLLNNALRHTACGGQVTVSCRRIGHLGRVRGQRHRSRNRRGAPAASVRPVLSGRFGTRPRPWRLRHRPGHREGPCRGPWWRPFRQQSGPGPGRRLHPATAGLRTTPPGTLCARRQRTAGTSGLWPTGVA